MYGSTDSSPLAIPAAAPHPPKLDVITRAAGFYAATRAGKKKVTAALDPTTHKQLKSLAVDKEVTTEALLAEAISDL
ncbi:ribbon-helix-helix domain-containing protein [Acidocella aquatica]|uniref:ribbon-helix-helix domain-containing protein n=1 Tax=Acidocella aquatica TaxID=1922313 RepID=UPI0038D2418F